MRCRGAPQLLEASTPLGLDTTGLDATGQDDGLALPGLGDREADASDLDMTVRHTVHGRRRAGLRCTGNRHAGASCS
jgi:hypothetical protein